MGMIVTFGTGGYCKDCDSSHDHPLNNIVAITEEPEEDLLIDEIQES
jgi:hypothetical protein